MNMKFFTRESGDRPATQHHFKHIAAGDCADRLAV